MVGVLAFTLLIAFINMIISAVLVSSYVSLLWQAPSGPIVIEREDPNWEGAELGEARFADRCCAMPRLQNRSAYPTTTFKNVTRYVGLGRFSQDADLTLPFLPKLDEFNDIALIRSLTPRYGTRNACKPCRFTLFVSIFNLVFGGAYVFFILKLGTSIIASIISFLGFLFILWIFWLASGASTATAYGGRFSCSNNSFAHCNQLLAMEAFSFINCALTSGADRQVDSADLLLPPVLHTIA